MRGRRLAFLRLSENGVETASILRDKFPNVKIVGFSALAKDPDSRDKLLATKNFDAVLSKFDGLDRLVKVVKKLMPDGLIQHDVVSAGRE